MSARLGDEDPALAEVPRLPLVGFLERQRAGRAAAAVQRLAIARHLHLDAGFTIIPEFAREPPAALLDGPEAFAGPRLPRRNLAIRGVEGLSLIVGRDSGLLLECGEVSGLAGEGEGALYLGSGVIHRARIAYRSSFVEGGRPEAASGRAVPSPLR